jgi:hypothetical protein
VRPEADRRIVGHLAASDLNASQIAYISGLPRSTVREWLRRQHPRARRQPSLDIGAIPKREYSYLLGFYLGDGTISRSRKGVYRLRIKSDSGYPGVSAECAAAMAAVMPTNRVLIQQMPYNAVEIGCSSEAGPLLFPQHGPGRKHKRKIELAPWQEHIVECFTREFIRGLIHSDGCRVLNRVNGRTIPGTYSTRSPMTSAASSATPAVASASATRGASGRRYPSRARTALR